jgi:hypothetical protein
MTEPSVQLLIRLPASLARRFKHHVAARQRSKFVDRLLKRQFSQLLRVELA